MRLIYVAGKRTDDSEWAIHQNIVLAEQAAGVVASHLSLMPVTPHLLSRNISSLKGESGWYAGMRLLMERCDALYVLPSWKSSLGTVDEILNGLLAKKPILTSEHSLRAFALADSRQNETDRMLAHLLGGRASINGPIRDCRLFVPPLHSAPACRINLDFEDEPFEDFGTHEWLIEVVSHLVAGGFLAAPPPVLIEWLCQLLDNLKTTKERAMKK